MAEVGSNPGLIRNRPGYNIDEHCTAEVQERELVVGTQVGAHEEVVNQSTKQS